MSGFLINPYRFGAAYDADAQTYITAVEAADGQALETGVRDAINAFVVGCKADGIWTAIKASCILAGARTLSGALVPLVGTAPTNNNFVAGDYNRKTGLVGNGSTKYLNSNRADNADPKDNAHMSVYASESGSGGADTVQAYIGGGVVAAPPDGPAGVSLRAILRANQAGGTVTGTGFYMRTGSFEGTSAINITGFMGATRNASASYARRSTGTDTTVSVASFTPGSTTLGLFAERRDGSVFGRYSNARLAFYSIGESLNLTQLDSRVSTLITALAAAIP